MEADCFLAPVDVYAIQMDSESHGLVVIPTTPRRKHSKSNSARIGSKALVWGIRGRRFESVSPTDARLAFATRGCTVCLGACAPTWRSALTRDNGCSCKRHPSPRLRADAAGHRKRLCQSSAYIALTVLIGASCDAPSDATVALCDGCVYPALRRSWSWSRLSSGLSRSANQLPRWRRRRPS